MESRFRARAPFVRVLAAVVAAVGAGGCGPGCGRATFDGDWDLPELVDTNPDPRIVEVDVRAAEATAELVSGESTHVWAYEGAVPGPMLHANVGDRVIVHFENALDVPTTIHWHGLRVPASMDGTEVVQSPIDPGASFTYDFVVPDAELAWFHPHVDSAEQVERGLQAALLVEDPDDPLPPGRVIVLDDVLLDGDGEITPFSESHMAGGMSGGGMGMSGRIGNTIIVNGHHEPLLEAVAGSMERWRIVNSANARRFHLRLAGAHFQIVGGDGGFLLAPVDADEIDLSPGERVDVIVTLPSSPGDANVVDRASGGVPLFDEETVLRVRTTAGEPKTIDVPSSLPSTFVALGVADVSRRVTLDGMGMMGGSGGGGMGYSIDGERWPNVTPITVGEGDVVEWRVVNDTGVAHPFHLHGQRFAIDGVDGWKDTVNVAAGEELRMKFVADNPGKWLFHCHILEHAEDGMMGELDVIEPH